MRKILVVAIAACALAIAACAPPAVAADNEHEQLSMGQFLALDTFDEANGATPQRAVLRWQGAEKYLMDTQITAEKRSSDKPDPYIRLKNGRASVRLGIAPKHPLRL